MQEIKCPECREANIVYSDSVDPRCRICGRRLKGNFFSIGSIVLHKPTNQTYVITNTIKGEAVATRTITMSNLSDWELISGEE